MGLYRKKPVVIEAMQFTRWSDAIKIMDWATGIYYVPWKAEHSLWRENEKDLGGNGSLAPYTKGFLVVKTLEGDMRADERDWIIKGVAGEFYPCKPDIFAATYEAYEEGV